MYTKVNLLQELLLELLDSFSADSGDKCVHYINRGSQCTAFPTGVVRCSGGSWTFHPFVLDIGVI